LVFQIDLTSVIHTTFCFEHLWARCGSFTNGGERSVKQSPAQPSRSVSSLPVLESEFSTGTDGVTLLQQQQQVPMLMQGIKPWPL